MKLPATKTNMYTWATLSKFDTANPIIPPIIEIKLTTPLQQIVCISLKLFFIRIATSPNSRGISWATIAIKRGTNSVDFPVAKATPKANPSIKLWIRDPIKFKYPDVPLPVQEQQPLPCCSYDYSSDFFSGT